MATMTLSTHVKQPTNRGSRGLRAKIDPLIGDGMQHAVVEGSCVRVFDFRQSGRVVARFILTASLALVVLAGTVALQAAIHVYVWHLAG